MISGSGSTGTGDPLRTQPRAARSQKICMFTYALFHVYRYITLVRGNIACVTDTRATSKTESDPAKEPIR